jgi:hypothetical protein
MKLLAEAFPGAMLVFATMKEASQVSKDELARIRKLPPLAVASASRQSP